MPLAEGATQGRVVVGADGRIYTQAQAQAAGQAPAPPARQASAGGPPRPPDRGPVKKGKKKPKPTAGPQGQRPPDIADVAAGRQLPAAPPPAGGTPTAPGGPFGTTASPEDVSAAGPFAGKGAFTAWDPEQAIRPGIDWIAVQPEQLTPEIAAAIRANGSKLIIWEPRPSAAGAAAVKAYNADGYIAQAEGQGELDAALSIQNLISVPKALVTNNFMQSWPVGWIAMPEAYTMANPQATVGSVTSDSRNRGAQVVIPIIGSYEEGGQRVPVSDYADQLAGVNVAGVGTYTAETLTGDDWDSFLGVPGSQGARGLPAPQDTGFYGKGGPEAVRAGGTSGEGGGERADWSNYFTNFGLPSDVQDGLNEILRNVTDPNQAVTLGLAFIRGTGWYKKIYPGITEGIAKGLITNEVDYRQMLNTVSGLWEQYHGRKVGGDEFAGLLNSGLDVGTIAKQLEGEAYVKANEQEVQFAAGGYSGTGQLTPEELQAFGRQQAGLSSPIGLRISRSLDQAIQRLQGLFQGQAATPAGLGVQGGRLMAGGLGKPIDTGL